MENEIPVTKRYAAPEQGSPARKEEIPDKIREISESISGTLREFRQSERYERILEGREIAREYIRNNPVSAFLYALGAGMFLGMLMKRKR